MKLILIDGGPASGKNTLGEMVVDHFKAAGEKAVLIDMDYYVEVLCPTWVWDNNEQKDHDLLSAKINFIEAINRRLQDDFIVVAIGARILSKNDVNAYISKISTNCQVYLFHFSIPIEMRRQRLDLRGPHSLINLDKDQKDRDEVAVWPGYVYENVNTPTVDALNLFKLILEGEGLVII